MAKKGLEPAFEAHGDGLVCGHIHAEPGVRKQAEVIVWAADDPEPDGSERVDGTSAGEGKEGEGPIGGETAGVAGRADEGVAGDAEFPELHADLGPPESGGPRLESEPDADGVRSVPDKAGGERQSRGGRDGSGPVLGGAGLADWERGQH